MDCWGSWEGGEPFSRVPEAVFWAVTRKGEKQNFATTEKTLPTLCSVQQVGEWTWLLPTCGGFAETSQLCVLGLRLLCGPVSHWLPTCRAAWLRCTAHGTSVERHVWQSSANISHCLYCLDLSIHLSVSRLSPTDMSNYYSCQVALESGSDWVEVQSCYLLADEWVWTRCLILPKLIYLQCL